MSKQSIALWVAAGVLAGGSVAGTRATAAEPQDADEIVVSYDRRPVRSEAPVTTAQGKSATGMPIVEAEIRHHIRFDDLDLTTEGGADELAKRVRAVARQGCAELDRLYAPAGSDADCTRSAVSRAMLQVNAAIAEAKAKPGNSAAR